MIHVGNKGSDHAEKNYISRYVFSRNVATFISRINRQKSILLFKYLSSTYQKKKRSMYTFFLLIYFRFDSLWKWNSGFTTIWYLLRFGYNDITIIWSVSLWKEFHKMVWMLPFQHLLIYFGHLCVYPLQLWSASYLWI